MRSDLELIHAVLDDEAGAADEWADRYRRLVLGLAHRRFGFDQEQAQEILQATVAALWAEDRRGLRAWRGEGKFSTYLSVVVCRLCRRRVEETRRRQRLERSGEELAYEPSDEAVPPDERASRRQRRQAIAQAVSTLKPRDRLVLALRFIDDREPREMAPLLGLSAGAVRKAVHDAVGRLRRSVRRQEAAQVVSMESFGEREEERSRVR